MSQTQENAFSLETQAFQGPLETLLNLIEARKMSISDISLAEVTDAYMAYVERLPELPLGETAQFILVASTLLLIKSRALLPLMELSEEEEESVHELERRLAQYALVRAASKLLRKQWGTAPLRAARRSPEKPALFSPKEASIAVLFSSAKRLLQILPQPETMIQAAVRPIMALEDVIASVRNRLSMAIRTRFSELTKNAADKHEIIVYFLATLELVRSGSASVTQDRLFEDITIEIEQVTAPRYGA